MNGLFFAAEAAAKVVEVIDPVSPDGWWKGTALVVIGMMLMKGLGWLSEWIDGKGKQFIDEKLGKLQDKVNENSVLAQVQADDAVFKIIRDAIPEVVNELVVTAKQDLKDGKLDKVDWEDIGKRLWARTKPHIIGGKNDYLANSSFNDGKVLASWVAKKVFNKDKAKKEGLVE